MRRGVLAALANLCVLVIPVLAREARALVHTHVLVFLLMAAMAAGCEAAGQRGRDCIGPSASSLALATGITLLACFWTALLFRGLAWSPGIALGASLMGAGTALRALAMRTLGTRFVSEVRAAPASDLITHGIYTRMRHPSETGLLCIAAGGCVTLASTVGLALCALVLTPLVVVRTQREDRQLHALFGEPYARYAARVRMLL
jgi:protein-S-isoprenylcysteine O-methyltransferase Ste14